MTDEIKMDELFTPQMVIDHHITQRGITVDEIGLAPIVVVSWGQRVIQSLAQKIEAQPAEHWFYEERPLFTGQMGGKRVSLIHLLVGAAGTVMMMEELIACGGRIFLALGWAGSLQPHVPVGTFIIPSSCIREEGVSAHYIDHNTPVTPDPALVELLAEAAQAEGAKVVTGPLWTTDAPYRELKSKVTAYGEQGVLGVDMETSAMYTLGQYRKVKVCNLLVVSDELGQEWRPAFGTARLKQATDRAERVILRCLESGRLG